MNKRYLIIIMLAIGCMLWACKKKPIDIDLKSITEDNALEEANKILKELDSI